MMMPKKFNSVTRSMLVLLIFKDGMLKPFCGIWNTINFDFETLMDNIFNFEPIAYFGQLIIYIDIGRI